MQALEALDALWQVFLRGDRGVVAMLAREAVDAGKREGDAIVEMTGRILLASCDARVREVAEVAVQLQALADEAERRELPRMLLLAKDTMVMLRIIHGHYEAALTLARQIDHAAEPTRSLAERAFSLYALAVAADWTGHFEAAWEYGRRAVNAAEALGHVATLASALYQHGYSHTRWCRHDKALPLCERAYAVIQQSPLCRSHANVMLGLAEVLRNLGRNDDAVALLRRERARPGMDEILVWRRPTLANLYIAAGRLDEAEACLSEFTPDGPGEPMRAWEWRLAFAELLCARGEYQQAVELARGELARPVAAPRPARDVRAMYSVLHRALTALGDPLAAAEFARLSQTAIRHANEVIAVPAFGPTLPQRPTAATPAPTVAASPTAPAPRVPRFVAHVTHELRTPIHGILSLVSLLQTSRLDEHQKRQTNALQQSAEIMLRLVNDLLDLTRMEHGHFKLQAEAFDLRRWLHDSFEPFALRGRSRGLAMRLDAAADLPQAVITDALRLRQLLNNLLDNAVKFTQVGAVQLSAAWVADPGAERGTLRMVVTDSGKGIAAQAVTRLFAEFSQEDDDIERRYGGTGLGLALCRQIVALMEGRIGVRSEPDRGSEFWVEVPLRVARESRLLAQSAAAAGQASR